MMKLSSNEQGFSLIELIVAIVLLALISGMVFFMLRGAGQWPTTVSEFVKNSAAALGIIEETLDYYPSNIDPDSGAPSRLANNIEYKRIVDTLKNKKLPSPLTIGTNTASTTWDWFKNTYQTTSDGMGILAFSLDATAANNKPLVDAFAKLKGIEAPSGTIYIVIDKTGLRLYEGTLGYPNAPSSVPAVSNSG